MHVCLHMGSVPEEPGHQTPLESELPRIYLTEVLGTELIP